MRAAFRSFPLLAAALGLCVLSACATPPTDPDALADFKQTNDPLEPTNRVFYKVNDGLDKAVLEPVARAYRYVVPEPVRDSVHNVLANIDSPVLLANDMFQGKPRRAGDTLARFFINTTAGVVGIFDVAAKVGYPAHESDFGMTMALWGVPDGPYLFLPLLGPGDPRDDTGFGVDIALDPLTYVGKGTIVTVLKWSRYGLNLVDLREQALDPIDNVRRTALDPYATFRSLYRQHRASEIEKARNDNSRLTTPGW